MKSNKTIFILLGVLIVLAIYIFTFDRPNEEYTETSKKINELVFDKFDRESISTISITPPADPSGTLVLEKSGDDWVISNLDNYKADSSMVETFLTFFENAKLTDVVSENPEKQSEFGVSQDSATIISLKGEGYSYDFYAGASGSIMNSQYIRLKNDDRVIQVHGNLIPLISNDSDSFRDKHLLQIADSDIREIVMYSDYRRFKGNIPIFMPDSIARWRGDPEV